MKVVTIEREFGAGGHTVGRAVAERLGVEFYDRDIIRAAAKASGLDDEQIWKQEEKLSRTDKFLRAITPDSFDIKDTIFEYEAATVVKMAKQGPCVILGRCGGAVLEQEGIERVSVFLYADEEKRLPRAAEMLETTDMNAARRGMRKIDTARAAYYSCYIGKQWNDARSYTLFLDTAALTPEQCVDIICIAAQ